MNRKTIAKKLARNQRGMTLIEIMVVIAILGLMGSVITMYFMDRLEKAKVDTTKQQMQSIVQSLDAYKIDNRSYPTTEQGLSELVNKKVLPKLPVDGWGKEFEYMRNSGSSYTLKSYGRDEKPGGEGYDGDIVMDQQ